MPHAALEVEPWRPLRHTLALGPQLAGKLKAFDDGEPAPIGEAEAPAAMADMEVCNESPT